MDIFLVVLFLVVYTGYFVVQDLHERRLCRYLLVHGERLHAEIVAVKVLWYLNYRPRVIDYRYTVSGETYSRRNAISRHQYRQLTGLSTIEIRYLAETPGISRVIDVIEGKTEQHGKRETTST